MSLYTFFLHWKKVVSPEYAQIKDRLQFKTALNKYVSGSWCERQQEKDFFTGESVIMDYGLIFWPEATV